ncbi:hypothetical protein G6F36_014036 [Rhizopus arrhizus]|nr:hypothetical protein G6F36_014036 [Rhizopus arrhizus]
MTKINFIANIEINICILRVDCIYHKVLNTTYSAAMEIIQIVPERHQKKMIKDDLNKIRYGDVFESRENRGLHLGNHPAIDDSNHGPDLLYFNI